MRMLKRMAEGSGHALTMILIFWGMVKNLSLDYAGDRMNLNMTVIVVDLQHNHKEAVVWTTGSDGSSCESVKCS